LIIISDESTKEESRNKWRETDQSIPIRAAAADACRDGEEDYAAAIYRQTSAKWQQTSNAAKALSV
jgi:hypothetical protein